MSQIIEMKSEPRLYHKYTSTLDPGAAYYVFGADEYSQTNWPDLRTVLGAGKVTPASCDSACDRLRLALPNGSGLLLRSVMDSLLKRVCVVDYDPAGRRLFGTCTKSRECICREHVTSVSILKGVIKVGKFLGGEVRDSEYHQRQRNNIFFEGDNATDAAEEKLRGWIAATKGSDNDAIRVVVEEMKKMPAARAGSLKSETLRQVAQAMGASTDAGLQEASPYITS